jgi:hypothetical protein
MPNFQPPKDGKIEYNLLKESCGMQFGAIYKYMSAVYGALINIDIYQNHKKRNESTNNDHGLIVSY